MFPDAGEQPCAGLEALISVIVYNSQGDSEDQAFATLAILCNAQYFTHHSIIPCHGMGGNQIDKDPSILTTRQQIHHPPLTVNHNKLTIRHQQLYTNTWLRSSFITLDENYMLNIKFPRKADLTDHDKYV